jgi:phage terminase small subunit
LGVNVTESYIFTPLQLRFIEEYPKDCRKGPAALRAGASPNRARQQGYEWYLNPHIRAAIDARMAALSMSADEAIKHVSNIATTRLNDFMVVRPVQTHEMLEEYVTVLMTRKKQKIKDIEAFIGRNKLEKEAREPFDRLITSLRMELLEDEQEVERWGDDVTRLVKGKPVVGYVADVDMVKVAQAKSQGRIKKLKHTKDGVEIEMYDAHKALQDILKVNGRYVQKVDLTSDGESLNAPDAARAALVSKLAEGQE